MSKATQRSLAKREGTLTDKERSNSKAHYHTVLAVSIALLVVVFIVALSVGRYNVPFFTSLKVFLGNLFGMEQTWDSLDDAVVMTLRLPRAIAAILIGSALALSGACYQSVFKNPMVSPDLLGVSSGACVGAAIAILLDMSSGFIQLFAFVAGLITVLLTTSIPRLIRNESTTILVLSGVIMSSLMSSIMNLIKFVADPDTKLAEITYWTMGSFATITFDDILSVLPAIVIPAAVILIMRFRLNVMSLGDKEAQSLGISLRRTRGVFILCSTLITASCVCLAGSIGWVGLVIPHISRLLVGADNKKLLPVALFLGAAFMLIIDTLCRTITGAELKLGILTGLVGAPFFFFILFRQHRTIT